jgi:hypothetical protein
MAKAKKRKDETAVKTGATAEAEGNTQVTTEAPPKHDDGSGVVAERLGEVFGGIQGLFSRNVLIAGGLILLAVLLFFVWRYFSGSAGEKNAELWFEWEHATDLGASDLAAFAARDAKNADFNPGRDRQTRAQLDALARVADANKGKVQGRLARFQLARASLYLGLRDLASADPSARITAGERVRNAADTYKALVDESSDVPVLAEEALLNGGRAYEALGNFAAARENYKRLKDAFPKSPFARDAEESLKRLDALDKNADLKGALDKLASDAKAGPQR